MEGRKKVKILVTGAGGFIGKNLLRRLHNEGYSDVVAFDLGTPPEVLNSAVKDCDFVFHLAGVNRPKDAAEFMEGNYGFTTELLGKLSEAGNKASVLITSSIQAELDNPYGKSKKAAEDYIFQYGKQSGAKVLVYRLPNVFGKWCRPNYNSAIATFCHNIARGEPIRVNDPNTDMHVVYIDDLLNAFMDALKGKETVENGFCIVPITHKAKLGYIADLIKSFKESRNNLEVPYTKPGSLETKLYSTYLSYLPESEFSYPLKMHVDARGSFTEFLRTPERGQVSVNITKSGITKGNHWHDSKNEKFLVVSGKASIKFKKIGSDDIVEYIVSSDKLDVVDIPTGYAHNITNIGDGDLVTVMWANEAFVPDRPDTYVENV